MLHHLVTLMNDEDDPLRLQKAGAYSCVTLEIMGELTMLWTEVLAENAWLVPEPVRGAEEDDVCAWLLTSLDAFTLGYMLASREQVEAPLETARCMS